MNYYKLKRNQEINLLRTKHKWALAKLSKYYGLNIASIKKILEAFK